MLILLAAVALFSEIKAGGRDASWKAFFTYEGNQVSHVALCWSEARLLDNVASKVRYQGVPR